MVRKKENPYGVISSAPRITRGVSKQCKYLVILFTLILAAGGLFAQDNFPEEDFWSLDAGLGMSNILVDGTSYQLIIDPKLWLSPALMVGSKAGINYSTDEIVTLEGQVYLRWNFLRLGNPQNTTNIFAQGGLGIVAAYRGDDNPFDNVQRTRGSILLDAALGVTIPLTDRWHIEPLVRGGYPHMWGVSVTAGYKFPLPQKTRYVDRERVDYREIIHTIPPSEIVKVIKIHSVEFVLFGPDIGSYNRGVDNDGRALNELVLNETAAFLKANPDYRVRLEGHANPVTTDPREADELMTLSNLRANAVAEQLRARGVAEEQMVIIAYGGTRTVTTEHDQWNRNRRVELIVLQVDTGTN